MTLRSALIPPEQERHFFEATYEYSRVGEPVSSKGILAHVLRALPSEYVIWEMRNHVRNGAPHIERGYTSFIIEDTNTQGKDCVNKAQIAFSAVREGALPNGLQHIRLVDIRTRPVTISRVSARLHAQRKRSQLFEYDVFLSYSRHDEMEASQIRDKLSAHALDCFMAGKALCGGDPFSEKIRDALCSAREMCILFTPNARKSEWVTTEWGAAWALNKVIVPVLLRTSPDDLPDRLRSVQCVDFHKISEYIEQILERRDASDWRS